MNSNNNLLGSTNLLSEFLREFTAGVEQTDERKRIGERSYVIYEALGPNQKVTFRSCFPGTIMAWNATPLLDGEVYTSTSKIRTIFADDYADRPHGIIRVTKGAFLCADIKVKGKVYHTQDDGIINFSETKDYFQEFNGRGYSFFEVHGDLLEIPLLPYESVDVFPGYLLGFTDSMTLLMRSAGDITLRNEENSHHVIRLTADKRGGYVYTHSVKINDFFERDEWRKKKEKEEKKAS